MKSRLVVVTFQEGEQQDRETFGPFDSSDAAWAWVDWFEQWFREQGGDRKIEHVHVLPMQDPVEFKAQCQFTDSGKAYLYVAVLHGQDMADYIRDKYPTSVLTMLADGWTIEGAINHIEGTCDHALCTGEHGE